MTDKATIKDVVDAIDRQTAVLQQLFGWPSEEACERIWADVMGHVDENPAQDGRSAPLADAGNDQAAQPATDAPEPAQTLADLTPCLGDRVRVLSTFDPRSVHMQYGWLESMGGFHWSENFRGDGYFDGTPDEWTVLTHLDPVTPEEPPVGSGMLVDRRGGLWRANGSDAWLFHEDEDEYWVDLPYAWETVIRCGPLRPATPADLARHGVGEDGEPVGKGCGHPNHPASDHNCRPFKVGERG